MKQAQVIPHAAGVTKIDHTGNEINELIAHFPFTSKVQGFDEMLASAIICIATVSSISEPFVVATYHTII